MPGPEPVIPSAIPDSAPAPELRILCPLSKQPIKDPVIYQGFIYDRSSLEFMQNQVEFVKNQAEALIKEAKLAKNNATVKKHTETLQQYTELASTLKFQPDHLTLNLITHVREKQHTTVTIEEAENMVQCPITLSFPAQGVLNSKDGHMYELAELEGWIQEKGTGPLYREPINKGDIIRHPLYEKLRTAIQAARQNEETIIDLAELFNDHQQTEFSGWPEKEPEAEQVPERNPLKILFKRIRFAFFPYLLALIIAFLSTVGSIALGSSILIPSVLIAAALSVLFYKAFAVMHAPGQRDIERLANPLPTQHIIAGLVVGFVAIFGMLGGIILLCALGANLMGAAMVLPLLAQLTLGGHASASLILSGFRSFPLNLFNPAAPGNEGKSLLRVRIEGSVILILTLALTACICYGMVTLWLPLSVYGFTAIIQLIAVAFIIPLILVSSYQTIKQIINFSLKDFFSSNKTTSLEKFLDISAKVILTLARIALPIGMALIFVLYGHTSLLPMLMGPVLFWTCLPAYNSFYKSTIAILEAAPSQAERPIPTLLEAPAELFNNASEENTQPQVAVTRELKTGDTPVIIEPTATTPKAVSLADNSNAMFASPPASQGTTIPEVELNQACSNCLKA